jgi:hypothetical protein
MKWKVLLQQKIVKIRLVNQYPGEMDAELLKSVLSCKYKYPTRRLIKVDTFDIRPNPINIHFNLVANIGSIGYFL